MFSSHILSRLLRFWLLGVFIVGLFVSIGEVSINQGGALSLSQGGWNVAVAVTPADGVATPGANDKKAEPINAAMDGLIDVYNMGIELLSIIITPLIMLAGWLLSPDWTFGEIFWLRPILHQLWIFISNIVYVIFGFILVSIAFANIFGAGWAEYEMKKMLPKLVAGILIVPFTWFIVSAVLSVSNILTASVIQLPVATINQAGSAKIKEFFDAKAVIPRNMTVDLTGSGAWWTLKKQMDCEGETKGSAKCITISELLSDANGGAYNLLTAYAYGIFNIDKYKDITESQINKKLIVKTWDILKKITFGIIFFIVFGVLVIAIVYALLTRAMMLWMFAIFSPLFALNFVLAGGKSKALEKLGKLDIKHFISLAMVPVYVSAALSFGLMFLSLVMNPSVDGNAKQTSKDGTQTFTMWQITLTTIGDPNMADNLGTGFRTGQGVLSTVILGFLALAILWMAVMAALSADEITGHAVEPIANFGKSVGELAVKAPQYIPLKLPGMDKGVSIHGMQTIGSNIKTNFETKSQKSGQEFSDKLFGKNELTNASRELTTKINNLGGQNINKDVINDVKDILKQWGDAKTLSENGITRDAIAAFANKIGIKEVGDLTNQAQMAKIIGDIDHKLETDSKFVGISPDWILTGRRWNARLTPDELKQFIAKSSASPIITNAFNIEVRDTKGTIEVNDKNNKPHTINVNIGNDGTIDREKIIKELDNQKIEKAQQDEIIADLINKINAQKKSPTQTTPPTS
ncbi:MAG: hypothetical protein ACD_78C00454G0004 [uncultured bacterium (gcode 4)]|uniref:Uncharacterized protein n=1 Tax=uncultured bacterium (gcode 4) TaxID=1234023 RepID=K1XGB7_9BACT|nr:MAG: hypothetical protein ACD_78C00454G0004 [uncultured bacterium (gcode 4)]